MPPVGFQFLSLAVASAGEQAPSGRRMKVMQALGLMVPPGSPFHSK